MANTRRRNVGRSPTGQYKQWAAPSLISNSTACLAVGDQAAAVVIRNGTKAPSALPDWKPARYHGAHQSMKTNTRHAILTLFGFFLTLIEVVESARNQRAKQQKRGSVRRL